MPRPKAKSDLDKHIGLRVGYVRRIEFAPQVEIAKELGISRNQLANIESGLVPLRVNVAWQLCRLLWINPDWLIWGSGEVFFSDFNADVVRAVEAFIAENPRRKFSEVRPSFWACIEKGGKPLVDNSLRGGILFSVRSDIPTWKQLVAALKRHTKKPGAKAQLAVDLETSRQNVNKWLTLKGAPSADLTLHVFKWVMNHGGWK